MDDGSVMIFICSTVSSNQSVHEVHSSLVEDCWGVDWKAIEVQHGETGSCFTHLTPTFAHLKLIISKYRF
jgi:hypothetical protein